MSIVETLTPTNSNMILFYGDYYNPDLFIDLVQVFGVNGMVNELQRQIDPTITLEIIQELIKLHNA